MNKYLILINTQGGYIPMHTDSDMQVQYHITYEGFTYWGTYKANTEEEALALAENDFITDYTQPTIPLSFKSFKLS